MYTYTVLFLLVLHTVYRISFFGTMTDEEMEDQIDQQQPPSLVNPLLGYSYLDFPTDSKAACHYGKLRRMQTERHDVVDWMALETIGEWIRRGIIFLSYCICHSTEISGSSFYRHSHFILLRPTSLRSHTTRCTPFPNRFLST
ncbi:hypothetical protein Hanom_Chr01g00058321 [Helianthus anomalus]